MSSLQGRRILLVEDEYMLADDLRQELEAAGAVVLGPVPNVPAALDLLKGSPVIDGAVLDIKLGGQPSFPIADALHSRRIPFLFSTGYDRHALPERYQAMPHCEKPVTPESIRVAIGSLIEARDGSANG